MSTSQRFYSCEFSQQAGEQLFGSATRADVWLCLEYTRPWGTDAFAESSIPESVKQHVSNALVAVPKSRLELIKRRSSSGDLAFYVAVSGEQSATLYRFRLDAYEDLLELDIPAAVGGAYAQNLSEGPAFLVCANGRRDICCARFGLPIYEAMNRYAPDLTWQCTHLGGHRFAANAVFLPEGICYGRIGEHNVPTLIDRYRGDQIHLETYRGRSCYDSPVQAADYFLRAETGMVGLYDFRLDSVGKDGEQAWTIEFEAQADGKTHQLQVALDQPGVEIYKNSGDSEKDWVPQYRLAGHDVIGGPNQGQR